MQVSKLGDPGLIDSGMLNFAVKVYFKGKSGGVKHGATILATTEVALYFARDLGGQAAFQIFTNKTDRGLAGHAHNGPPEPGVL
jgi:hypothetical protein